MPKFTLQHATKIALLKLWVCIKSAWILEGVSELPGGVKEHHNWHSTGVTKHYMLSQKRGGD